MRRTSTATQYHQKSWDDWQDNTMIRIATINLQGIGTQKKIKYLEQFIKQNKLDIIAIQESAEAISDLNLNGYSIIKGKKKHFATALIHKNELKVGNIQLDREERIIKTDFKEFTMIAVYGHANEKTKQNQFFQEEIQKYIKTKKPIIMLGDFNANI